MISSGKDKNLDLINADPIHTDLTKKKIKTLDLKLSKSEISGETFTIFKTIMTLLDEDALYFIATDETVQARKRAIELINFDVLSKDAAESNLVLKDNPYVDIINELFDIVSKCETHCLLSEAKRSMWQEFYMYLSSKENSEGWQHIQDLVDLHDSEFDLLTFKMSYGILEK
eukprot:TCONS_00031123-protein